MKKRIICIAVAALMCTGCTLVKMPVITEQENEAPAKENITDVTQQTSDIPELEVSQNTTASDKTEINDSVDPPVSEDNDMASLMDVSKFSYKEVPLVKDAVKLVRPEIFDESYEWEYIVQIPEIESKRPGAVALNEKLYSTYSDLLDIDSCKAKGNLHRITYNISSYDGIILIHMNEVYGLYQSEGATLASYYYYDSINDKELTVEEYTAHFGLDTEKLARIGRWCIGDEEWHRIKYAYEMSASEDVVLVDVPENGRAYFTTMAELEMPQGYEVTRDKIYLYYRIRGYTSYEQCVEIDIATSMPSGVKFGIFAAPTGILEADFEGISVTYENGKIINALISENIPVHNIELTSDRIRIVSDLSYKGFDFDSIVEVNGKVITDYGMGSELYGEDLARDTYYYPEIEYNDRVTVKIINK